MIYLLVIIFGVVQGVTEFLPISSSGHLILLHHFFAIPVQNELAFDIFLHLSTLLAVIYCFYKDIWRLARSFVLSFFGQKDEYSRTAWLIIFATIPAALAGVFLDDIIETKLHDAGGLEVAVVAVMLILVAILFILVEKREKGNKDYTGLKPKEAMLIGTAQALALIPGTSRSGITIIAGLLGGLKREEALRFSFLLSIPIILGASIKKVPLLFEAGLGANDYSIMGVAFISSFLAGVLAIKFFLGFARDKSLIPFAYYRIGLAFVLLLYLFVL
jgi:undecaprenyl-diphosphatase